MRTVRGIFILAAILLGIPWLAARVLPPGWVPLAVIVVVGLAARTRGASQPAAVLLERLRTPSPRQLGWATFWIWALASAYFCFTAFYQHRDLIPRIHDEHSYLLQARLLATGRLWAPAHPVADSFENFFVLARPVYAPIYFPGTALADAPFVRFGAPYWLMPLLAAGLVVALTYLIVTLLVDGAAGIVAAACAISNWGLRQYSTMVMSQVPVTMMVLLMFWCWLRWRRGQRYGWTLALGACMGWSAIMRPVDALAFALPITVAIAWSLRDARRMLATFAVVVVAAAPFLAIQAALNHGTTGSFWKTPYTAYLKADQPGSEFGFHPYRPEARPASALPQKRDYIDRFRAVDLRRHTLSNLPRELVRRLFWTGVCTLPAGILAMILLPAAFGLNDSRRLAFFAAAPLFILLYLPNPFFLVHYTVPLVPIAAFAVGLAIHVLSRGDPATRAYLSVLVLSICASVTPELRKDVRDGTIPPMPVMAMLHDQLNAAVGGGPAIVLIRYQPGDNPNEEPVYNDDVISPDDAPVIRAHDLGPRNVELARYYARTQPSRRFYLFDRRENLGRSTILLHPLGTAAEYERALRESNVGVR